MVTQALWNATYIWSWSELTDRIRVIHPMVEGAGRYTGLVNTSIVVIDEHLEDEDFDPADPAISALYEARDDLADALKAAPLAAPGDYLQIWTEVDMIECSEESAAIIHTETGRIQVIHQLQNC